MRKKGLNRVERFVCKSAPWIVGAWIAAGAVLVANAL